MNLKNAIIGICLLCVILLASYWPLFGRVGYSIIRGGTLQLMGYPVDVPPWELAKQIIASGKDPSYCMKLQQSVPVTGPTIESRRTNCVYEYAKLTKDPTACELIMPSEYGLACMSSIWGPLIDASNCHWYQTDSVRCFEGEKLVPHVTVCAQSFVQKMPDECWHRIAFRNKDAAMCGAIENSVLRSVCVVRINTWKQFPELRSTQYFSMP